MSWVESLALGFFSTATGEAEASPLLPPLIPNKDQPAPSLPSLHFPLDLIGLSDVDGGFFDPLYQWIKLRFSCYLSALIQTFLTVQKGHLLY